MNNKRWGKGLGIEIQFFKANSFIAKPLGPKQIVTVQELAVCNMLEIEALRQCLFEKEIISEEEFIARYKKLDREMKEKGGR